MISDPQGPTAGLEREIRLHKRLRERLLHFSRGFSSSFSLKGALEPLIAEIREILGAKSVEIWLHERRSRQLAVAASDGGRAVGERVPVGDLTHYAADGLRLERPEIRGAMVLAPLRGWRRALGTLVVERHGEGGDPEFVEVADEVA